MTDALETNLNERLVGLNWISLSDPKIKKVYQLLLTVPVTRLWGQFSKLLSRSSTRKYQKERTSAIKFCSTLSQVDLNNGIQVQMFVGKCNYRTWRNWLLWMESYSTSYKCMGGTSRHKITDDWLLIMMETIWLILGVSNLGFLLRWKSDSWSTKEGKENTCIVPLRWVIQLLQPSTKRQSSRKRLLSYLTHIYFFYFILLSLLDSQ